MARKKTVTSEGESKSSNVVSLEERRREPDRKPEVPKGSTWTLRGMRSDVVMLEGISQTNAPHLLRGRTSTPLADVLVGEDVQIEIDGITFKLQRSA